MTDLPHSPNFDTAIKNVIATYHDIITGEHAVGYADLSRLLDAVDNLYIQAAVDFACQDAHPGYTCEEWVALHEQRD